MLIIVYLIGLIVTFLGSKFSKRWITYLGVAISGVTLADIIFQLAPWN